MKTKSGKDLKTISESILLDPAHAELTNKINKKKKKNNKKGKDRNNNLNTILDQLKIQNTSLMQVVMNWLFSKDLANRIKTVAIEKKNFLKIIKQMYHERLSNPKVMFKFKGLKFEEYDEDLFRESFDTSLNSHSFDLNTDFQVVWNTDKDDPNYEALDEYKIIAEDAFIKELRFFKIDENSDAITLSSKLLSEENWFKDKITLLSDGKIFTNSNFDFNNMSKFNLEICDWLREKKCFTLSEYFIALMETILLKKFVCEKNQEKKQVGSGKEKINISDTSILQNSNFNELMDNREWVAGFLKKFYPDKEKDSAELFKKIDLVKIISDCSLDLKHKNIGNPGSIGAGPWSNVTSGKSIARFFSGTKSNSSNSKRSKKMFGKMGNFDKHFDYLYSAKNSQESGDLDLLDFETKCNNINKEEELEKSVINDFLRSEESVFVDNLIFSDFLSIINDNGMVAIARQNIFDALKKLYTEKNVFELMNEKCESKGNSGEKKDKKKKKKNKKKGKNNKSDEENGNDCEEKSENSSNFSVVSDKLKMHKIPSADVLHIKKKEDTQNIQQQIESQDKQKNNNSNPHSKSKIKKNCPEEKDKEMVDKEKAREKICLNRINPAVSSDEKPWLNEKPNEVHSIINPQVVISKAGKGDNSQPNSSKTLNSLETPKKQKNTAKNNLISNSNNTKDKVIDKEFREDSFEKMVCRTEECKPQIQDKKEDKTKKILENIKNFAEKNENLKVIKPTKSNNTQTEKNQKEKNNFKISMDLNKLKTEGLNTKNRINKEPIKEKCLSESENNPKKAALINENNCNFSVSEISNNMSNLELSQISFKDHRDSKDYKEPKIPFQKAAKVAQIDIGALLKKNNDDKTEKEHEIDQIEHIDLKSQTNRSDSDHKDTFRERFYTLNSLNYLRGSPAQSYTSYASDNINPINPFYSMNNYYFGNSYGGCEFYNTFYNTPSKIKISESPKLMSNNSLFRITKDNSNRATPKNRKKAALSPPLMIPDIKKYPFLNQIRKLNLDSNEHLSINDIILAKPKIKKTFPNNEILTVSEMNDMNNDTALSSDLLSENHSNLQKLKSNYSTNSDIDNHINNQQTTNNIHVHTNTYLQHDKDYSNFKQNRKYHDDIGILNDYRLLSLSFIERYNKEMEIKEEEELSVDRCTISKNDDNDKRQKKRPNLTIKTTQNDNQSQKLLCTNSKNKESGIITIGSVLFNQNNKTSKPCPVGMQQKKKLIPVNQINHPVHPNQCIQHNQHNVPVQEKEQYTSKKSLDEINTGHPGRNSLNTKKQRTNPIIIRTPDRKILDSKFPPEIDIKNVSNQNYKNKKDFMEKRNFFFTQPSNNLYEKVFGKCNNITPTSQQRNNVIHNINTINIKQISNPMAINTIPNSMGNLTNIIMNNTNPLIMFNNNNNQFMNFNDQNLNYMYPHLNYPSYSGNKAFRESFNLEYNFGKITENFSPFPYTFKLHNDIVEYSSDVTVVLNELKELKSFVVKFISDQIKNLITQNVDINVYGSFSSDLSIESSDIDIQISYPCNVNFEVITSQIIMEFTSLKVFDNINPILTATVPVIKVVVDPLQIPLTQKLKDKFEDFKRSKIYKKYRFDKSEIEKFRIDITFYEQNKDLKESKEVSPGMHAVEWAIYALSNHPEIKPIMHVMKRYLQVQRLNSPFNGGLSSFSLLLLLYGFVKYPKYGANKNFGKLLLDFLEFYGKYVKYTRILAEANMLNPFAIYKDGVNVFPVILDPITNNNVGKPSFRIDDVRESFFKGFETLIKNKVPYEQKNNLKTENYIYSLLLKNEAY